ncbi:unnamed protein product [Didymodactylos carnosus]|uniref:Uncharacterized protein n=1 Tax=Didymodactylos carnosus TaxID=1234261 RepID=A0A8S2CX11_9BILA|nr:unnamed protein product [Didymodactylos carnosus]CAF3541637.1 unnamed protein product [Didymodactylos carnosus]
MTASQVVGRSNPTTKEENSIISILIAQTTTQDADQNVVDNMHETSYSSFEPLSRFKNHIIPKLNLKDTIWILNDDKQQFFITCFVELGQQLGIILEELRRAEIGIRNGSRVSILPLSNISGIQSTNENVSLMESDDSSKVVKDTITTKEQIEQNSEAIKID